MNLQENKVSIIATKNYGLDVQVPGRTFQWVKNIIVIRLFKARSCKFNYFKLRNYFTLHQTAVLGYMLQLKTKRKNIGIGWKWVISSIVSFLLIAWRKVGTVLMIHLYDKYIQYFLNANCVGFQQSMLF